MNMANTVLPIVEEEVQVGKRRFETERVRVRTVTDSAQEFVRQELTGEHLEVERVVIDLLIEPGADLPRTRTEGNVTILPILEEVVVVEKRLRLKEEVRITKRVTTELTETPMTVRKQRAVIERLNSEGGLVTDPEEITK
jgi:stress response protein YsnF